MANTTVRGLCLRAVKEIALQSKYEAIYKISGNFFFFFFFFFWGRRKTGGEHKKKKIKTK